jgi:hypothetical protein
MIRELPAYEIAQIRFAAMQPCFEDSMASRFGFIIAILTALLGAPPAKAQAGPDPTGIWLTQAGDAKVRVSKCGGGICGVVIWLKDPINPATGKPQVDDKNPNPSLARRPMIGLPCLAPCSTLARTNGPARSTMPMTATAMPATFRCRIRTP